MLRLLLLVGALSLVACAPDTATLNAPAAPAPAAVAVADPAASESFAAFFERFRTDLDFQRERLTDDYAYRALEETADGFGLVEQPGPFEPSPLDWAGGESVRTTFTTEYSDAGVTEDAASVDPAAVSVEYQITGTDNGVSISYRFVRGDDGLWRLAEIQDSSM